jgi:hypothetical protein
VITNIGRASKIDGEITICLKGKECYRKYIGGMYVRSVNVTSGHCLRDLSDIQKLPLRKKYPLKCHD